MDVWPDWWEWEVEFTPHLLKRMIDRQFSEPDLRQMLDEAMNIRENHEEGRFAVRTKHHERSWESFWNRSLLRKSFWLLPLILSTNWLIYERPILGSYLSQWQANCRLSLSATPA